MRAGSRLAGTIAALCAGTLLTTACQAGEPSEVPSESPSRASAPITPSETTAAAVDPVPLTFGVFGNAAEIETWRTAVRSYNEVYDADVRLRTWPTWRRADAALRSATNVPDVFLLNHRDLAWYLDQQFTQPVDELLDERGVNFGDDYSRDAMEAFSVGTSLACMPVSLSPMVVYVNTDLVDRELMVEQGDDAPDSGDRWTFDQFAVAADVASRPRRSVSGVYVEPTLQGLAPFVLSGGGSLFDDAEEPTTLELSTEESNAALERTLTVLRDAQLSPSPAELDGRSPLDLFRAGELGMITGFRDLTPVLRRQPGLEFDVMPMPVLESGATVGDLEGLCLSADTADTAAAADFLAFALAESTLRGLARAGRTVPANVVVGNSPDFLQPFEDPQNSRAFIAGMRYVEQVPLIDDWDRLEASVHPLLSDLLTDPVLDLPLVTSEIDQRSRRVLAPETIN